MSIETTRFPQEMMPGAVITPQWRTDRVPYGNGHEFRDSVWEHPLHTIQFRKTEKRNIIKTILDWNMNSRGAFKDFLFRVPYDFTSHSDGVSAHAFADQVLGAGNGSIANFQLVKNYTAAGDTYVRPIQRPVAGTVLAGIGGVQSTVNKDWTLGANGLLQFINKTGTITGITQAAQAVVTQTSHGRVIGETVHLSGVVGMTQVNGKRYPITAVTSNTFTIGVNSTGFTAYASGGTGKTLPQTGETVTAGYEFDMLVHFQDDGLPVRLLTLDAFALDTIVLQETRI
jgi:uncharacterized protein (TIGR02217 family)